MDLQNLFATVVNMTLTGSIVIGVVLPARLALGRGPKVFAWALWLVVLFRLLCPVSVSAPVSVLGAVDAPAASAVVGQVEYVTAPSRPAQSAPSAAEQENREDWRSRLDQAWLVGAAAMALFGALSYAELKRRLRESVPAGKGIREADGILSPFVLGVLRPVIYLPSDLEGREREYILLHERQHIRHGDPLVKGLFWLAVCIHWFNPLVWLAFFLCARDMELRCDEAVLKKLGGGIRSDYAQSLLNFAVRQYRVAAPLAFGETDTGKRVKFVLNWKKKKLWITIPAAILCAAVLVLSACNPGGNSGAEHHAFDRRYRAEAILGQPEPAEAIYWLRDYDSRLCRVWSPENVEELGVLEKTRLDSDFGLADQALEQRLRQENDVAWKAGEYWLLYQDDHNVYLTQGRDRVLRLTWMQNVGIRVQTPEDFGVSYQPAEYPIGSGRWEQEEQSFVTVSGNATLIFTQTGEKAVTVVEEYHQIQADGTEIVTQTSHMLAQTQDYGFELPIARRGETNGDWAMYRLDLGLSSYVFYVRFDAGAQAVHEVYRVGYQDSAGDFDRTFTLSPKDGAYVHFQVKNLRRDLYCFAAIGDGEVITLEPGEAGVITVPVRRGDYRFHCGCDIDGVQISLRIVQTDDPVPPEW